jgi:hypothetical protein
MCSAADDAADEMLDLDNDEYDTEGAMASQLPASSQWMAMLHGKFRAYGRVSGNVEWEYFQSNITNFQGGGTNEADNYSSIRFSDMADSWNKWVDSLGTKQPSVTYKTASYLKDAYKSMKRRARQQSTLRPHKIGLDALKEKHNNHDTNRTFAEDFPTAERAAPIDPTRDAATTHLEDGGDAFENEIIVSRKRPKKKEKRSKALTRCRRCGKCYALPEWKVFHEDKTVSVEEWGDKRAQSRHLRNSNGNKVWDLCTVDPAQFEEGFPCLDLSKRLPRLQKK